MKALAARIEDREDAKALIRSLGISRVEEALAIIERYIPPRLRTARTQYFVESLFPDQKEE